jgi:hypothetical protein
MSRLGWILIAAHAALLAWGASLHSPTLNEPGHLVSGVSNWQFRNFEIYKVNPLWWTPKTGPRV